MVCWLIKGQDLLDFPGLCPVAFAITVELPEQSEYGRIFQGCADTLGVFLVPTWYECLHGLVCLPHFTRNIVQDNRLKIALPIRLPYHLIGGERIWANTKE
mgnify:CR=1 FL=1